jgi:hypothetical protein
MLEEKHSLMGHGVWEVVPLSEAHRRGRRPIRCKWIYKLKLNKEGEVSRFKARLVACGYSQVKGIDFHTTFAPTLLYKSFRVVLTLAAQLDWEVDQMDVETAFLYGTIEEEVYMELPPGLQLQGSGSEAAATANTEGSASATSGGGGGVSTAGRSCMRLKKALYGTKQASNVWWSSLDRTLRGLGFRPCEADRCVYTRVTPTTGDTIILGVFVDDVLIFYSRRDAAQWSGLKAKLRQRYRMKDLGAAEWVLGMQLIRDRKQRTIGLSIARYVDKMCNEFRLTDANPMPTPEAPGQQLHKKHDAQSEEERQRMAGVPYRELVGSLLYAQVAARPDIAHAVAMLTRHMQDPGEACWTAAKRCLRFLKGTKDRQLIFGGTLSQSSSNNTSQSQSKSSEVSQLGSSERKGVPIAHPSRLSELKPLITVWCDADWAGDQDDRRSTSGAILQLFGSSVSWHSKKQSTVALSSAEAEYVSLSAAVTGTEAMWLSQLLTDIGCPAQLPMQVRCDNQAAIRIAAADGSVSHSRVKHIAACVIILCAMRRSSDRSKSIGFRRLNNLQTCARKRWTGNNSQNFSNTSWDNNKKTNKSSQRRVSRSQVSPSRNRRSRIVPEEQQPQWKAAPHKCPALQGRRSDGICLHRKTSMHVQ